MLKVRSFSSKGLATGCVLSTATTAVLDKVICGDYQLVFFTPEALLNHRKWCNLLRTDAYVSRLRVIVIDEAHTVVKW